MTDTADLLDKYHKMLFLENRHHFYGHLPIAEYDQLKQLHTMHGAGLFDSIKEYLAGLIYKKHPVFQFLRGKAEEAKRK